MTVNCFISTLENNWEELLPDIVENAKTELLSKGHEINFLNKNIKNIQNCFGVYLFQIYPYSNFNIDEFKKAWKSEKMPKYSPSISKSRIEYDKPNKWYPFYIGKAEKLSDRINEHCFQEFHKTTYSLKLCSREELLKHAKFCVSHYEITSDVNVKKYAIQFVMTNLERELREKLSPWIGKQ